MNRPVDTPVCAKENAMSDAMIYDEAWVAAEEAKRA